MIEKYTLVEVSDDDFSLISDEIIRKRGLRTSFHKKLENGALYRTNIRPKSYVFLTRQTIFEGQKVYAVLYTDGIFHECLCFFVLRENRPIIMCRCVGARIMKKHWEKVQMLTEGNREFISNLKLEEKLDFSVIFES